VAEYLIPSREIILFEPDVKPVTGPVFAHADIVAMLVATTTDMLNRQHVNVVGLLRTEWAIAMRHSA